MILTSFLHYEQIEFGRLSTHLTYLFVLILFSLCYLFDQLTGKTQPKSPIRKYMGQICTSMNSTLDKWFVQVEVMRGLEDRDFEYKSMLNEKLQGTDGSGLIQVYRKELEDRLSVS